MHITEIVIDKGFEGLNPMQYGRENCEKGHFFGPAIREHWLLHYVVSGNGIFKIGNKRYKITKGDIFIIPPFVKTFYQADLQTPWEYIWIGFTASGALPIQLPDVIHLPEAKSIFKKMEDCALLENGRSAFLAARLWDLFSLILEQNNETHTHIQKAISFIHSEYMNDIKIGDISDLLNLERTYFSALFKKETGKSPQKYLFDFRMEIAARLLTEQNSSPVSVANSVGYTDFFNFSRMFKKHFGLSPKNYKLKYLEEKQRL